MASVARALLQLAQIGVLARLLSPQDFGLMSIVSLVLGFAYIFSDMGVNAAYVQRQDVTTEQRSSLFWLNVGLSVLVTAFVMILSPAIAGFFDDDRLVPLIMLAAMTFVLSALGQQIRMTSEKALEFGPVIFIEVGAAVLGFAVAVTVAKSGFGVYSLIWGAIVAASSGMLLSWIFLAHGWRPMWHFRVADVQSYLGFGSALVISNMVNEINRNVDLILGGRMLAAAALGFYSVPRQLIFQIQNTVNPIVTRVGFPLIAEIQSDLPKVRKVYLQTLNMTASTNAPLYLGIAFFSPEVVQVLMGDKWIAAAGLLRLLAIWGFFRSVGNPAGSLLLGMGRADLSLRWNLGLLVVVPPTLWGGSHFGSLGLAWALLGLAAALFIPGWYILIRPLCHARLLDYSIMTLRPFFIAFLSTSFVYYFLNHIESSFLKLALGIVFSASLYMTLSYFLNRDWIIEVARLLKPIQGIVILK
ncbi:hypothetical protein A8C75_04395 [Marinobacterium aestuarii]|uniref:Colanic acid exporter n=2 Tax=Marinobacterium aestuarii TaxID=1821621 RepID=A0A1A9EVG4_9GAMM|nr:hypothetical protein A8C75_04395 [Marinobacterium aestuarii]